MNVGPWWRRLGWWGKLSLQMRQQFFGNILCYVNLSKTTVWSVKWIMGWRSIAVEKEHSKQLANMTMKLKISVWQRRFMANSKDQKWEWHPCPKKVFFGRKTGPAMLAPVIRRQRNSIQNVLVEKKNLNSKKLRWNFEEVPIVTNSKNPPVGIFSTSLSRRATKLGTHM